MGRASHRVSLLALLTSVEYDMRGNLSRDDGFDADSSGFFEHTYDAENRLTEVNHDYDCDGLTLMAQYRYDAASAGK